MLVDSWLPGACVGGGRIAYVYYYSVICLLMQWQPILLIHCDSIKILLCHMDSATLTVRGRGRKRSE